MPGDIKTRFTIEGEQKFRSAMTNAANAVKVLNSEQKLAKAQFQNTGNAEKYAAAQADILKKKIEQQKVAVKAAEQALKQLSDGGVSHSSRQFQQWQTKLNNAKTSLVQMETELQNVGNALQETTNEAGATSDAIDSIGKKVSFDAVIGGIGKITGAMESAIRTAKELATELVSAMTDSASWADELATTSTIYGLSADEVQRMRYTADILDTSFEAIFRSRQKLVNAMQSDSDVFGELGVQIREASIGGKYGQVEGDLRNWEDVFWDLGAALTNIEKTKGFEYVNKQAQQLFGRNWEQLKPIFNSDWASADNYLKRPFGSAREYYEAVMASWNTVSEEDVKKLTEYDDALQKLQNELETLQNTVAAQLAPGFTDITNAVSGLVSQFNEYLQTDEGKEKLQALSDTVSSFFSGLTNVDFGQALDTAKNALDDLKSGLEWIKNNGNAIIGTVKGMAIAFGALKLLEGGLSITQLLASGKYLFGGGGGSKVATDATADAVGTAGVTAAGGGLISKGLHIAPYAAPFAIAIDQFVHDQQVVSEAMQKGAESILEYQEKSALYSGSEMFDIWDTLTKYATVNGDPEDRAAMEQFVERYWKWWNDEITDPALDEMAGAMSQENFDLFHDIMGRMARGEQFYSNEDIASLAEAMNAAIQATESVMKIPAEAELPDNMTETLEAEIGKLKLPAEIIPTWGGYPTIAGPINQDLFKPHANGLFRVPWDGYPAVLHKGEQVVPAREISSRSYNSNLYVESMIMNNGTDAEGLAAAMAAAQRRTMSGYGS